jgi:hypothetical protein
LIRHQLRGSGTRAHWEAPFVDKLFTQVISSDENVKIRPIRTSVLDSHFGYALMQLTAWVFHCLPGQPEAVAPEQGRGARYLSGCGAQVRLRPGGDGFFGSLIAKFDTEGWRPARGISEMLLPAIDVAGEELGNVVCRGSFLAGANLSGVNFAGADLRRADLTGGNLEVANLSGAYLERANLYRADLYRADLYRADLTGASLEGAYLEEANLKGANLKGANLKGASLKGANLKGASLKGANLEGANLEEANLEGANLEGANSQARHQS